MMQINIGLSIYIAILFIILTPGVLFSIPPHTSTLIKAVIHGILFAVVYFFTNKRVWQIVTTEGFKKSSTDAVKKKRQQKKEKEDRKKKEDKKIAADKLSKRSSSSKANKK